MRDLLSIEELTVAFDRGGEWTPVVREASLRVGEGEFIGLVGESGSGKSMLALAVLRLTPPGFRIVSGRTLFKGKDLVARTESEMRRIRGGEIGFVFQEPMTTLDPVFTIGFQVGEAVRAHKGMSRKEARTEAERLLDLVGISPARSRLDAYPHELSGGQLQRVVLAMALAGEPKLLIADEPTSALDVSVQAEILQLLEELRGHLGLAVLLITHDLAVVAGTCESVFVMYAGQMVEAAPTRDLFEAPTHPYTRGLLASVPRMGSPQERGRMRAIPGQAPALGELPAGCAFHPRCSEVMDRCLGEQPEMIRKSPSGAARCFLVESPVQEGKHIP
jgi:oligopeptide/dipeptide ABC transporter ATP-binding protein